MQTASRNHVVIRRLLSLIFERNRFKRRNDIKFCINQFSSSSIHLQKEPIKFLMSVEYFDFEKVIIRQNV